MDISGKTKNQLHILEKHLILLKHIILVLMRITKRIHVVLNIFIYRKRII
jgi:hypothetical protein